VAEFTAAVRGRDKASTEAIRDDAFRRDCRLGEALLRGLEALFKRSKPTPAIRSGSGGK